MTEARRPHAAIIKFPGTNCDAETARALEATGFTSEIIPFASLTADRLDAASLLVFAGGFSYGDYVMAGRLAQLEWARGVGDAATRFRDRGGYILGICNGFQILTKLGLLPEGSLIDNTSGRYQCRWVELINDAPDNAFLRRLPERFELPIAHAEGRFVIDGPHAADYRAQGLVALRYANEVNGSAERIAALQDESGRVFGLMPHPERFLLPAHHYDRDWNGDPAVGWGHHFFASVHDAIVGAAEFATVPG